MSTFYAGILVRCHKTSQNILTQFMNYLLIKKKEKRKWENRSPLIITKLK